MKKALKQFIKGLGMFSGVVSLWVIVALITALLLGIITRLIVVLFLTGWALI